jgi:ABC-type proline/glycine betaine transport system substrate-binding protein
MDSCMAELKRYNVHLAPEQLRRMQAIYQREGPRVSDQIRLAIDQWIEKREATEKQWVAAEKAARRRAARPRKGGGR